MDSKDRNYRWINICVPTYKWHLCFQKWSKTWIIVHVSGHPNISVGSIFWTCLGHSLRSQPVCISLQIPGGLKNKPLFSNSFPFYIVTQPKITKTFTVIDCFIDGTTEASNDVACPGPLCVLCQRWECCVDPSVLFQNESYFGVFRDNI